jgi:hypothetical protein
MQQLIEEAKSSRLSDIFRAILFLQRAREVRAGCRTQRTASRAAQATAWKKKVDDPARW